jgi:DNA-binding transcriptional LysR family regulator
MELEVRHLRVLCAIADAGSLHKAARELGMAQPSLSTQLRRIEHALGGALFTRERSGCHPTTLGRAVLSRARPLVAELTELVAEARATAARMDAGRLRLGATGSPAIPGWLRRLRARSAPGPEPTLQMDVSANALLRMVADAAVDVAFVHEVEGCPLRVPQGLAVRVLVAREPQFVALAADHPLASRARLRLADLTGERWMVDTTVDGERDGVFRLLREAGLDPHILHGDYSAASQLVATGEVVTISQPTGRSHPGMAIVPIEGDPLGVRLLLAARTEEELDAVYGELAEAYWETAWQAPAYRDWLRRSAAHAAAHGGDGAGSTDDAGRADGTGSEDDMRLLRAVVMNA